MSDDVSSKSELLARIDTAWAAFKAALDQIDPASMTTPGVETTWSVKDVLHHITAWETHMIRTFEAAATGQRPEHALGLTTSEHIDALNANFYAAGVDRPLDDVMADLLTTHALAVTAVANTPAPDLFEPDRFEWRFGNPLWRHVGGNMFWHYEEHQAALEQWAAAHPGS